MQKGMGTGEHGLPQSEKPDLGGSRSTQGKRGIPDQFGRARLTVGKRATMKAKSE